MQSGADGRGLVFIGLTGNAERGQPLFLSPELMKADNSKIRPSKVNSTVWPGMANYLRENEKIMHVIRCGNEESIH